jgi:2-iminobutanoate/2-iminopropanoate deaminase
MAAAGHPRPRRTTTHTVRNQLTGSSHAIHSDKSQGAKRMANQTRRGLLKSAAKAAVVAAGAASLAKQSPAQTGTQTGKLTKKDATGKSSGLPFTTVVSFGNLLFVSGIGCRIAGTIEEETNWVLDEIEKNLAAAGSSLDKVLKVNVFLEDIKEFDRMNAVYKTRKWGTVFPARNTVQPAALPAGDHGLAIDCIAYV